MLIPGSKLVRTLLGQKPAASAPVMSLLGLFILTLLFAADRGLPGFASHVSASGAQVFGRHEYWRLFTSPLLHADIHHLGSNALFFTILAYLLNGYFGFWVFPVLSFLAGGVINFFVLSTYTPEVTVVGASGVVYFMAAFWLTLYFWIERGISKTRRAMNAIAFAAVLFIPETLEPRVSYLSHAVGFGVGTVAGGIYFMLRHRAIRAREVWREIEPEVEEEPPVNEESPDFHELDSVGLR